MKWKGIISKRSIDYVNVKQGEAYMDIHNHNLNIHYSYRKLME